MKILRTVLLEKYNEKEKYEKYDDVIFLRKDLIKNKMWYCMTLYVELEDDEDTQYPLEDVLDKYNAICTYIMEDEKAGKFFVAFELETLSETKAKELLNLVGKRVFNVEENDHILLKIQ